MRRVCHEISARVQAPDAISQLLSGWRIVVLACVLAVAASTAVSLLMTRKYTAVSRVLVDPPAGSDPRVSTAVSPIYLESLRTYEAFASSDDLFQKA